MYLTLIAGFVILLIVLLVLRKTVSTSMWPNCALCRSERRKRGVGAWVCFGVWPPAIVIAADVDLGAWPITLSILIPPLLGLAFATQCSWSTITKAVVTDDGQSVCLRSAHPDFVAALPRVPPDGWPAPSAPVALPPTVTGWPDTCQRASNVVVPPWDQASG